MGIYDRDYYRQPRRDASAYIPRSAVVTIIVVNVALWLLDSLSGNRLFDWMSVRVGTLTHPLYWWQFLTYGFAHDPHNFEHILFNMLGLFFLGRSVEETYGAKEFTLFYLATIVVASVAWCVANQIAGTDPGVAALGASGGVTGVVILFALTFPHQMLLLFFVIPVPAWFVGLLIVGMDMYGATGRQGDNVAYSMHLAGAAFAFLYRQRGWNLTTLSSKLFSIKLFQRKSRLRVHAPETEPDDDLTTEVDRILGKIYREGEASLTSKERKTLEAASREYQRKGDGGRGPSGGGRP